MTDQAIKERFNLNFNPFEPAASGAPLLPQLWIPAGWQTALERMLPLLESGEGVKALALEGEYGSGKTYLLKWLELEYFPRQHIRSFLFDNPGVQFYDLANNLLRQVGRYEFAKTLWEYTNPQISLQLPLVSAGSDRFYNWLEIVAKQKQQTEATRQIASIIRQHSITDDEEIANRLAETVVGTREKPYFEYRDFVVGRKGSLVAENEEAPYFMAIIRALRLAGGLKGVAFLLDEFEEISLQKRLTRKEAYDYLATLKRLINAAQSEDFWLVVALTPQAAEITRQLEASLWDRFTSQGAYEYRIAPLRQEEAEELIKFRLDSARESGDDLFPFPRNFIAMLQPTTYSSPRRLVKVAFYLIAEALQRPDLKIPFTKQFISEIESNVYPGSTKLQTR